MAKLGAALLVFLSCGVCVTALCQTGNSHTANRRKTFRRPKQNLTLPISETTAAYAYELANEIDDYPSNVSKWRHLQNELSESSDTYIPDEDDPYSKSLDRSLDRLEDMIARTKGDQKLSDDLRTLYALAEMMDTAWMENKYDNNEELTTAMVECSFYIKQAASNRLYTDSSKCDHRRVAKLSSTQALPSSSSVPQTATTQADSIPGPSTTSSKTKQQNEASPAKPTSNPKKE